MRMQREKAECFRDLHERDGAFVIPNPWDAVSARLLEGMGFEALATTSARLATTHGRLDGDVSLAQKLAYIEAIRRLQAFAEVGADVPYTPTLGALEEVITLASAVDKPVNVLIAGLSGVTLDELADAGANRIGAGLARFAAARLAGAAQEMCEGGFTWFDHLLFGADMKRFFG
jgi:2-methylisocitrate lyase-like PEP mutase family enzyme